TGASHSSSKALRCSATLVPVSVATSAPHWPASSRRCPSGRPPALGRRRAPESLPRDPRSVIVEGSTATRTDPLPMSTDTRVDTEVGPVTGGGCAGGGPPPTGALAGAG